MNKQLEFLKIYAKNRSRHLHFLSTGKKIYYFKVEKGDPKLQDEMLMDHLNHKYSIGVIPFKDRTSFVGIDFDYKGQPIQWNIIEEYARKSINIMGALGIPKESIIISKSGMKGVHVDFLFDSMQWNNSVKNLLNYVVNLLDLPKVLHIDKRGCNQAGYKLPLGLHFKTGQICSILDINTFLPISDFDAWYDGLNLVNNSEWQTVLNNLPYNEVTSTLISQTTSLSKGGDIKVESKERQKPMSSTEEVHRVIERMQLLKKGSRNNIMFKVGLVCKDSGMCREDIFELGATILYNTPEELFNDKTDIEWKFNDWNVDLEKIFKDNKSYYQGEKHIDISVEVLKEILKLERYNLMQTAFLHYCMSQFKESYNLGRYYTQRLLEMKPDAIHNNFSELINRGWIKVLEKGNNYGGFLTASTYEFTKHISETKESISKQIKLEKGSESIPNLIECVGELLTVKEVKSLVSPQVFYSYFANRSDSLSMRSILKSIEEL